MNRAVAGRVLLISLLLSIAGALVAVSQTPNPAMTGLLPPGALLVLETDDFSSLVNGWDRLPEKASWLASDNHAVFERSRLFLRLKDAQEEFAAAAGFQPEMSFLRSVAGTDSRLALYDIGNLQFLFVTRLPAAQVGRTLLWQTQARFEPREIGEIKYFVYNDEKTERVVAFAAHKNHLLLATREDLLTGALRNLLEANGESVLTDAWYERSVSSTGKTGNLRMILNLEAILPTPHFRSYWAQKNQQELTKYKAGVIDLHLGSDGVREERVFLKSLDPSSSPDPGPMTDREKAVREILRLVPPDAGLYRAWASPSSDQALDLVIRKLLGRYTNPASWSRTITSRSGNRSLEIRIDQPPAVVRTGGFAPEALKQNLEATGLRSMLHVQSSRDVAGDVFVTNDSVIVLTGGSDWKAETVCAQIAEAVRTLWTVSSLGLDCKRKTQQGHQFLVAEPLSGITVMAREKHLFLGNSPEAVISVADRLKAQPPAESGEFVGGFRHARERDYFKRLMAQMDFPWAGQSRRGRSGTEKVPQFLSDNIVSLSDTLKSVSSVTVSQRTRDPLVYQTVVYRVER